MSRAAALKAWVTMRTERAAAMGVALETEQPLNIEGETDFGGDECHECGQTVAGVHVCSSNIRRAREVVLSSLSPQLRLWGWAWVDFILGEGARPKPPRGLESAVRAMELRVLLCGLGDPDGVVLGADNNRRRKAPRRHTATGKQPEALRQHLADQRNHRSGRMY